MAGMSEAPPAQVTLVLGGARSGKSIYAESLVAAYAGTPVYVATAEADDDEMAERIARHQARRGAKWHTVEQPLELVPALKEHCRHDSAVLVDCLTLWLSNLLAASRDVDRETDALTTTLGSLDGPAVLVSNEVGLGIVPDNPLARAFRDQAGRLNQSVAAAADHVVFIAAGLPMTLKP